MTVSINSRAWRRFRLTILRRDGRRCQRCGTARKLAVHHKKRRAYSPEKLFDPDNCQTICFDCHCKEHSKPVPPDILAWKEYVAKEKRP